MRSEQRAVAGALVLQTLRDFVLNQRIQRRWPRGRLRSRLRTSDELVETTSKGPFSAESREKNSAQRRRLLFEERSCQPARESPQELPAALTAACMRANCCDCAHWSRKLRNGFDHCAARMMALQSVVPSDTSSLPFSNYRI